MTTHRCIGWWQQTGFGRQAMENLHIELAPGGLQGFGRDIVGRFTLQGDRRGDGLIEILKQYQDAHSVLYVGQYDGEGTFYGSWDIAGAYRGIWSIKVLEPLDRENLAIKEIQPGG